MQRFVRTVALVLLGLSLGSLDLVVRIVLRLPFQIDTASLEVNHVLVSWHVLVRIVLTAILAWLFLSFRSHCVIATREESTRVVTRV